MAQNPDYDAFLGHLPDPSGTMTLKQKIEVAFFGGFVGKVVPANVSPLLHLEAGKHDMTVTLNSVSKHFLELDMYWLVFSCSR